MRGKMCLEEKDNVNSDILMVLYLESILINASFVSGWKGCDIICNVGN